MKTQAAASELQIENPCLTLPVSQWRSMVDQSLRLAAIKSLESGKVLFLPSLAFTLTLEEQGYLRPDCVAKNSKSVKYAPKTQKFWGASEENVPALKQMLARYAQFSQDLIASLLPHYSSSLIIGNTSFRPVEAQGRVQSKRHDDRLLHVDAFPSRPMRGKRILRVFTNINQSEPRHWRAGEHFSRVAERYMPQIPRPLPGSAAVLHALKITKEKRSLYDHYMLNLHDRMKLDDKYQAELRYDDIYFPPGSSWIVFSDQVSHAAISGQHLIEQTFLLPPGAMLDHDSSPLRMLEILAKRPLL